MQRYIYYDGKNKKFCTFGIYKKFILRENTTQNNLYTIAFYNLENLFDVYDDPDTLDDDFTPGGRKKWNTKKYQRKLKKLSSVLAQIGVKESGYSPAVIGLAEVENYHVIKDLIKTNNLDSLNYEIVHFDSEDERGVEVALLYRKSVFELIRAKPYKLYINNDEGERDYTRDILVVKGKLQGETHYYIINHWPSRRSGEQETQYKRIKAAELIHRIIAEINKDMKDPKIIIMGDFNDDPTSVSIKQHLINDSLYNPFESLFDKGNGSLRHEGKWHLFDQIIFSKNFFETNSLTYANAYIFDEHFLKEWKGKRKGKPFRTYIGKWHQGGYSDHFPVYITLEER